jgi:hypothetical protein
MFHLPASKLKKQIVYKYNEPNIDFKSINIPNFPSNFISNFSNLDIDIPKIKTINLDVKIPSFPLIDPPTKINIVQSNERPFKRFDGVPDYSPPATGNRIANELGLHNKKPVDLAISRAQTEVGTDNIIARRMEQKALFMKNHFTKTDDENEIPITTIEVKPAFLKDINERYDENENDIEPAEETINYKELKQLINNDMEKATEKIENLIGSIDLDKFTIKELLSIDKHYGINTSNKIKKSALVDKLKGVLDFKNEMNNDSDFSKPNKGMDDPETLPFEEKRELFGKSK